MNSPTNLVLITDSFPYTIGNEEPFLNPELDYHMKNFSRVFVVPLRKGKSIRPFNAKIKLESNYALQSKSYLSYFKLFFAAIFNSLFWNELASRPISIFQPKALKNLLYISGNGILLSKWLYSFIITNNIDVSKTVFYTYWLIPATLGITLLKIKIPELKAISRAHGFDLYSFRHNPPYIPLQSESIKGLNRIFFISEHGRKYFIDLFPEYEDISFTARLGVRDPHAINKYPTDGVFRFVSCSYLTSVKRVDLIIKSLIILSRKYPHEKFEWHHIGDGPLMQNIVHLSKTVPSNFRVYLYGSVDNDEVIQIYKSNPFDVFLNVSLSEGISVAIMEAMSFGLPIIATATGGTPEIVSEYNGRLLPVTLTPNLLANTIWEELNNFENLIEKRKMSLQIWGQKYFASKNYKKFSDQIFNLIQ